MFNKLKTRKIKNEYEFYLIINELIHNETVQEMKNYRQHYDISTFTHCLNVSYYNYKICKALHLDYKSAARAGMLHDLFLYDWRNSKEQLHLEKYHAFIHPQIALDNSKKIFDLNEKEQDIILKHMWPVTIKLPKYKESYIITITDKYSAILESLGYYKRTFKRSKILKYAYTFLIYMTFVGYTAS